MTKFITSTDVTVVSKRGYRAIVQGAVVAFLCAGTLSMVGCGKTIKPEEHKPTQLVQLAQQLDLLQPVFSASIAGQAGSKDPLSLQVGLDNGQLIVASRDGMVSAYNLEGKALWKVNVGSAITGGVAVDSNSDTAVVTTRDAQVIALDSSSGKIRWQRPTAGTILSSALIHNNRVIVSGNDGMLQGLSLQTGTPVWQFATQVPNISVRGSASPVLLDDNTTLIATADGRLHAINIETGQPLWSRRVGIPSGASEVQRMTDIDGEPVIDNGQLFAISYSGQLIGVDLRSETILFVQDASSLKSLATTKDSVIATTLSGDVRAFNRVTGEPMWENSELRYRQLTNPVLIGSYIAVGDLEGKVHLLSPQTGQIVSRTGTKGALSTLQVQADNLLTQSQSGQVSIWRLKR